MAKIPAKTTSTTSVQRGGWGRAVNRTTINGDTTVSVTKTPTGKNSSQTGKPAAVAKVRMSPQRRAEFYAKYPTPELRAQARARIKAGRPARLAAKASTTTSSPDMNSNTKPSSTTVSGGVELLPEAVRKALGSAIKPGARVTKTTTTSSSSPKATTPRPKATGTSRAGNDPQRKALEAAIRKIYGGNLPY